jgi:hypothetical protein
MSEGLSERLGLYRPQSKTRFFYTVAQTVFEKQSDWIESQKVHA